MSKSNQKTVKIHKEICDGKHIYAQINREAMGAASRDLNDGAFKLWVYLSANQDGFSFDLSSKAIQNEFGMKKGQYDAAVKELIEKGYLVDENAKHPPEDVRNYYGFYQLSQKRESEVQQQVNFSKPDEEQMASLKRIMIRLETPQDPKDFDFG